MNYLAHLYLADNSPGSLIGRLLGDFVKGNLDNAYDEEITRGILIYRRIDSFSDSHEKVLESKRLISPKRRRFSSIIIGVSIQTSTYLILQKRFTCCYANTAIYFLTN